MLNQWILESAVSVQILLQGYVNSVHIIIKKIIALNNANIMKVDLKCFSSQTTERTACKTLKRTEVKSTLVNIVPTFVKQ